jgi:hypothetical protein
MFIEIDNYFCIDTSEIRVFKQCDNKTTCVIYIKDDPKGLTFEDKQGKLYNSLKKIFNVYDALYPDIKQVMPQKVEQQPTTVLLKVEQSTSDDKIRW